MSAKKVRDVNMEEMIRHDLAGVPTSKFKDTGEMRFTKSKSILKTKLQVELADRR